MENDVKERGVIKEIGENVLRRIISRVQGARRGTR